MTKKILAITMVIVMLLGLVTTMTGCNKIDINSVKSDPTKQVMTSIDKTMEAFKASNNTSPLAWVAAAMQKGAITVETKTDDGTKLSNTLYANKEEQKYANQFTMTEGDKTSRLDVYMDSSNLAVSAPDILGEGIYGLDLQNVHSDLKNSALWDSFGMSYEEFDAMFGDFTQLLQDSCKDQETGKAKEAREMLNKIKEITKQAQVTVDDRSVITITDMAKSINITYTLNTDQLKQIADIFMDWAGANTDIFQKMDNIDNGIVTDEAPKSSLEEMKDELKKALDSSRTVVKVTVSINPKTETVMKIVAEVSAFVEEYNESFRITLDLGEDVSTSTAYKFRISKTNGPNKAESVIAVDYERMDTKGMYDRRLKVLIETDKEEAEYGMRFAWIMSDMSYGLQFDLDGTEVVFGGFCKTINNTMDFTVTGMRVEKDVKDVNLRILIEPNKEVPAMPEYTNILKMSAEEMGALLEKLGSFIPNMPDMPDNPIPDNPDNPDNPDDPVEPKVTLVKFKVVDYNSLETVVDMTVEGNTLADLLAAQDILVINEEGLIVGLFEGAPPTAGSWVVAINDEAVYDNYQTIEIKDDDVVTVTFVAAEDLPDEPEAPETPEDPADPSEPEEPTEPTDPAGNE